MSDELWAALLLEEAAFQELHEAHTTLHADHETLETTLADLQSRHENLTRQHADLDAAHEELRTALTLEKTTTAELRHKLWRAEAAGAEAKKAWERSKASAEETAAAHAAELASLKKENKKALDKKELDLDFSWRRLQHAHAEELRKKSALHSAAEGAWAAERLRLQGGNDELRKQLKEANDELAKLKARARYNQQWTPQQWADYRANQRATERQSSGAGTKKTTDH